MSKKYRLILDCALFPLLTGTTIFLSYVISHQEWLMSAGIITIIVGLLLFVIGAVNIVINIFSSKEAAHLKKIAALSCLLLMNFPVALGMTLYANNVWEIENVEDSKIFIFNNSDELVHISLSGPTSINNETIDVAPHSKEQKSFRYTHDGSLYCNIKSKSFDHSEICSGYVVSAGTDFFALEIQTTGHIEIKTWHP